MIFNPRVGMLKDTSPLTFPAPVTLSPMVSWARTAWWTSASGRGSRPATSSSSYTPRVGGGVLTCVCLPIGEVGASLTSCQVVIIALYAAGRQGGGGR
jgi:hypothetical protein